MHQQPALLLPSSHFYHPVPTPWRLRVKLVMIIPIQPTVRYVQPGQDRNCSGR